MEIKNYSKFPYFQFQLKHLGNLEEEAEDDEQKMLRLTAKYDEEAMTYLSYALYPLVILYSFYSLVYESHKSWYSWVLGTLVGSVYTFGFIGMCPQLYLNYKLKSVAHMPWRQMTYKALNTFIDDLFSFIITMPTLHRLSVFRDDIIFFCFLYQRWIYRIDYTRVNEFGFTAADADTTKKVENAANKELTDKAKDNESSSNEEKKKALDDEKKDTKKDSDASDESAAENDNAKDKVEDNQESTPAASEEKIRKRGKKSKKADA